SIDPLVVRDGDDVELGLAFDVVENILDARGAVARERVDVQVGASAPVGCRAHAAAPVEPSEPLAAAAASWRASRSRAASGSRATAGSASPSRSGQSGKKTA